MDCADVRIGSQPPAGAKSSAAARGSAVGIEAGILRGLRSRHNHGDLGRCCVQHLTRAGDAQRTRAHMVAAGRLPGAAAVVLPVRAAVAAAARLPLVLPQRFRPTHRPQARRSRVPGMVSVVLSTSVPVPFSVNGQGRMPAIAAPSFPMRSGQLDFRPPVAQTSLPSMVTLPVQSWIW